MKSPSLSRTVVAIVKEAEQILGIRYQSCQGFCRGAGTVFVEKDGAINVVCIVDVDKGAAHHAGSPTGKCPAVEVGSLKEIDSRIYVFVVVLVRREPGEWSPAKASVIEIFAVDGRGSKSACRRSNASRQGHREYGAPYAIRPNVHNCPPSNIAPQP